MKGNGATKAGAGRWRRPSCGASGVRKHDNAAKRLGAFLRRLLSKDSTAGMGVSRSTFWRRTEPVWRIWPIAPFTGEVHDTVFLDGIRLRRQAAALAAVAGGHAAGWRLAQGERAAAWAALMARMPAPAMLASDGSPGLAKAARAVWPTARVQRCAFHAADQVERCTALNPEPGAGIELPGIANGLKDARGAEAATAWLVGRNAWCVKWDSLLKESTVKDGKGAYAHERLRKAGRALGKLAKDGTLLTFAEVRQEHGGDWSPTNNAVESVNPRLREMPYLHRGLPPLHRVKAAFWWRRMHAEDPLPAAEVLRAMPTDDDVDGLFAAASGGSKREDGAPEEYGTGIVWEEFHMPTNYRR